MYLWRLHFSTIINPKVISEAGLPSKEELKQEYDQNFRPEAERPGTPGIRKLVRHLAYTQAFLLLLFEDSIRDVKEYAENELNATSPESTSTLDISATVDG